MSSNSECEYFDIEIVESEEEEEMERIKTKIKKVDYTRLKCGEIILVNNVWRIIFACDFCGMEFRHPTHLLKHTLHLHVALVDAEIDHIMERIANNTTKPFPPSTPTTTHTKPCITYITNNTTKPISSTTTRTPKYAKSCYRTSKPLTTKQNEHMNTEIKKQQQIEERDVISPNTITRNITKCYECPERKLNNIPAYNIYVQKDEEVQPDKKIEKVHYRCEICHSIFLGQEELQSHQQLHGNNYLSTNYRKPKFVIKSPMSPQSAKLRRLSFSQRKKLLNGLMNSKKLDSAECFPCKYCRYVFTNSPSLLCHMKEKHFSKLYASNPGRNKYIPQNRR